MCIFKRGIEKEETMKLRIMSQSLFQCHAIYMVTDFDMYLIIIACDQNKVLGPKLFRVFYEYCKLHKKYMIHNKLISKKRTYYVMAL